MPRPRKVDQLPQKLREWLRDEIVEAGYGNYEEIADNLNARLKAQKSDLRIQKTAIANYGGELKDRARLHAFAGLQTQSAEWTAQLMTEVGLEGEAESHKILFQMVNALAFKAMKPMLDSDEPVDPGDLQLLGRMMKDVMSSSGIREKLVADAEERAAKKAREEAAANVEKVVKQAGLSKDLAASIISGVLGVPQEPAAST